MSSTPDDAGLPLEDLLHHRAWLRALSRRLVGPGLADDLVQETWLAALQRPQDPARPARPWLAAIARRIAGRLRGSRGEVVAGTDPPSGAPSSAELLARLETEARLAREVARLDEPFRRTVLLRYHEGLSAAEIARRDGVPAGTVRWRLKHGLDALRARLDREYGDRGSWAVVLARLAVVPAGTGTLAWKAATAAMLVALAAGGGALWLARTAEPDLARAEVERTRSALRADAPDAAPPGELPVRLPDDLAPAATDPGARVRLRVAPATGAGPYPVRLAVEEEHGVPAAGLLVLLRTRAEPGELPFEPQESRTGADGRVAFAVGEPRTVEAAITRPSAPAHVVALEPDAPELRVVLQAGARLAGRVRVGGAAPPEPLEVEIYASDKASDTLYSTHPSAVRTFLFHGGGSLTATTDVEGRFAFAGLPDDWHGTLRLPKGFARAGELETSEPHGRVRQFVPAPADDLVLDVEAFPFLRGRIVEADGTTPVPEASVGALVTWADRDGEPERVGAATGDDGRFALFLRPRPVARVELDYRAIPDRGRADLVLARGELPPYGELGDLPLDVGRAVLLRFVDAGGAPIEGALVRGQEGASNARGELTMRGIARADATVRGVAFGYEGRPIDLPAGAAEVVVELARANRLDVLVLDHAGDPLQGWEVELSAGGGPFFVSERQQVPEDLMRERHAGQFAMARTGAERSHAWFRTDRDGRFSTGALRPGVELVLAVQDACAAPFHEERLAPLGDGEHREVRVRLSRAPREVSARVVDRSGAPLEDARVMLRPIGGSGSWREKSGGSTGADGCVSLGRLAGDAYLVSASKRGYVRTAPERVAADGREHVVVLEPGLDVVVRVRDAAGLAVAGGSLVLPGTERDAVEPIAEPITETAPGRFELDGLADAPLDVALALAGATYVQRCDPRVAELVFEVPVHGAVEVEWAPLPGDGGDGGDGGGVDDAKLVLIPREEAIESRRAWIDGTRPTTRTITPVLPGSYVAVVRVEPDDEEERDVSVRVTVEVRPGETARVALEPLR